MIKWVLIVVLAFPALVCGSENCVEQYKGTCRDACTQNETAAEGAFIDCTEKQDCCVQSAAAEKTAATPSSAVNVLISGDAFKPASVSVKAGTVVVWQNKDSEAHTVTANDGSFDSGQMEQGAEFRRKFDKAGVYEYSCAIHPDMMGKIEVK